MKHYRIPFKRNDGQMDTYLMSEQSLVQMAIQKGGKWLDVAINNNLMDISGFGIRVKPSIVDRCFSNVDID